MSYKVILFVALVAVTVAAKKNYHQTAPIEEAKHKPYSFNYNIDDYKGREQFHREYKDSNGRVTGTYGFKDGYGVERIVEYVADDNGYRAQVKTNEPGTHDDDPAHVIMYVEPAPLTAQTVRNSQPARARSARLHQQMKMASEDLEERTAVTPLEDSYHARHESTRKGYSSPMTKKSSRQQTSHYPTGMVQSTKQAEVHQERLENMPRRLSRQQNSYGQNLQLEQLRNEEAIDVQQKEDLDSFDVMTSAKLQNPQPVVRLVMFRNIDNRAASLENQPQKYHSSTAQSLSSMDGYSSSMPIQQQQLNGYSNVAEVNVPQMNSYHDSMAPGHTLEKQQLPDRISTGMWTEVESPERQQASGHSATMSERATQKSPHSQQLMQKNSFSSVSRQLANQGTHSAHHQSAMSSLYQQSSPVSQRFSSRIKQ